MDTDGMPLVGAGVDYEKVCAIEQKRTIAFLNHFIMHTTRFLNRFSNTCEEKLETISTRIDRLDSVLKNLESKLNSVPGLESVPESNPVPATSAPAPASAASQPAPEVKNSVADVPEPEPEPEPETTTPVCKDPRFEKYFKMLNMGVPLMAVQNKMRVEGADPDLINTPNAPAPPMTARQDSDDGFSDSDDADFSD